MLVYAGYKAGKNWEAITVFLKQYNEIVLIIIIAGVIIFALKRLIRRSQ
jgi:membrane protein DedA with SNARE-associated domain